MLEPREDATGGIFSLSYEVTSATRSAFLKALDYSKALNRKDQAAMLSFMTGAFVFERDLLQRCSARKMGHVVQSITAGNVVVDPESPIGTVDYLIFERADGDLRGFLSTSENVELAWKLRSLHNIANGLRQLHSEKIAHQDVKPSNVLVFGGTTSKVADLGCASVLGKASPRDDFVTAGDGGYAPPELLYGHCDPDWGTRRLGCDAYLLGSMIEFMFAGLSATTLLFSRMQPQHLPRVWSGEKYSEVLPYLRNAFVEALNIFAEHVPEIPLPGSNLRLELKTLVQYLCEPDPARRGHPKNKVGITEPLSLERFVTRLDLLARRTEIQMKLG